jgi:hypothetical protein
MLDRPQLADLVIPDLARWQDWSAMDRLVQLFKEADEQSSWVRVPVIKYLKECPLPEAKQHIEELAKIDPKVVQQANSLFPLAGAPAPPPQPAGTDSAATPPAGQPSAPATADEPTPPAPATTAKPEEAKDAPAAATDAQASQPAAEPARADAPPAEQAATAATTQPSTTEATSSKAPASEAAEESKPAAAAAEGDTSGQPPAAGATAPSDGRPSGAIESKAAERSAEFHENPTETLVWVLAVPLAVGVVLMGLLLVILRGQRRSLST